MVLQLCEAFTQPALESARGDVSVEVSTELTKKHMKTVHVRPHLNSPVKFRHGLVSDFKLYLIILASNCMHPII